MARVHFRRSRRRTVHKDEGTAPRVAVFMEDCREVRSLTPQCTTIAARCRSFNIGFGKDGGRNQGTCDPLVASRFAVGPGQTGKSDFLKTSMSAELDVRMDE